MDCRDCTMAVQRASIAYHQSSCGMLNLLKRRAGQHQSTSSHLSSPTSSMQPSNQAACPQTSTAALSLQSSKGNPLDTGSYRPIPVTEPIMRLYAGILNARIVQFTEDNTLWGHTQTGFRPGLATQHN